MNGFELTTFITSLANFISCQTDNIDDLTLLGAIFTQLGDTLATLAIQRNICDKLDEQ